MSVGFEVGSWYKVVDASNSYRKCSNSILKNYCMSYNEGIDYGKYSNSGGTCSTDRGRLQLVTDINKIREYLPEGHIDLITYKNIYECW